MHCHDHDHGYDHDCADDIIYFYCSFVKPFPQKAFWEFINALSQLLGLMGKRFDFRADSRADL